MTIPILNKNIDERFLTHRLKSTSLAGVVAALLAIGLFSYHYYIENFWSWDLFAVAATMAGVKIAAMAWYHFTD